MTATVEHLDAVTWHGRKGAVENAFSYSIDYVLVDAEAEVRAPAPFARNRRGVFALLDRDHGGPPHGGRGAVWVREVMAAHGIDAARVLLLAQPRVLGHVFNPVSFWLIEGDAGGLIAVIAEVTNTFGDRHSYLARRDDGAPITPADTIRAKKIFHVSPFQPVSGGYAFRFDVSPERIAIRIDYSEGAEGGLVATLAGRRRPLTRRAMARAMLRRPFGSRRVLALIHWQALKLWWKGAPYRARPEPPGHEVSG